MKARTAVAVATVVVVFKAVLIGLAMGRWHAIVADHVAVPNILCGGTLVWIIAVMAVATPVGAAVGFLAARRGRRDTAHG